MRGARASQTAADRPVFQGSTSTDMWWWTVPGPSPCTHRHTHT